MTAFTDQMAAYKQRIDADIERYAQHVRATTKAQFGAVPAVVTNAYLDLLTRGGKRIRGALVICGYEMCGGTDQTMITRAATALELLHAGILVIDDIQDRSDTRRGSPTVHRQLADYARAQHWPHDADPDYTGASLALDAALTGIHAAEVLLAGLDADPQLKINVLGIVNQTVVTTAHGQTYDIVNSLVARPPAAAMAKAREWKSAHYTFLNPLCVGMVLAGAGCEDTDAIRDYALHTGLAFQIADDLMDGDIKGAVNIVKAQAGAAEHIENAQQALAHSAQARRWQPANTAFLKDLSEFVVTRRA